MVEKVFYTFPYHKIYKFLTVLGIGIDIVDLNRMRNALNGDDGTFLNKVFTRYEVLNSKELIDAAEYFSLLFAFKESFVKAKGSGFTNLTRPKYIETRFMRDKKFNTAALSNISMYFKNKKVNLINAKYFKFKDNVVCELIIDFL